MDTTSSVTTENVWDIDRFNDYMKNHKPMSIKFFQFTLVLVIILYWWYLVLAIKAYKLQQNFKKEKRKKLIFLLYLLCRYVAVISCFLVWVQYCFHNLYSHVDLLSMIGVLVPVLPVPFLFLCLGVTIRYLFYKKINQKLIDPILHSLIFL